MKAINVLTEGLGAGAVLVLLFASAFFWKSDPFFGGRSRGLDRARSRRSLKQAERLALQSPDFLDICRRAGL